MKSKKFHCLISSFVMISSMAISSFSPIYATEDLDIEKTESTTDIDLESSIQEEGALELEHPDLPVHNTEETYQLAMQIMEQDLAAKNNSARMSTFSTMANAGNYVDNFFNNIIPPAIEDSVTSGILPSITIAQGVLESAWGLSGLAVNANNLFGIKASSDWNGEVYNVITSEYAAPVFNSSGKKIKEGYWYQVVAPFRKYDNWLGSVRDHGLFFTSTEWRKIIISM